MDKLKILQYNLYKMHFAKLKLKMDKFELPQEMVPKKVALLQNGRFVRTLRSTFL